jgi:hypothetical protein
MRKSDDVAISLDQSNNSGASVIQNERIDLNLNVVIFGIPIMTCEAVAAKLEVTIDSCLSIEKRPIDTHQNLDQDRFVTIL